MSTIISNSQHSVAMLSQLVTKYGLPDKAPYVGCGVRIYCTCA